MIHGSFHVKTIIRSTFGGEKHKCRLAKYVGRYFLS